MGGTVGNNQEGSPLFSKLPAEIRCHIFELALAADDDTSKPYRADRKYYRPGYRYHPKIRCSLLQTCKRVYGEARLLPVSVNEHVFWLFNGPWKTIGRKNRNTARWKGWYASLNEDQRNAVRTVHIFTQQYYLEGLGSHSDLEQLMFKTERLHLTIRHSDWWSWESPPESNDRLGICPWREFRTSCQQMLCEPLEPSVSYIKQQMTRPSLIGDQAIVPTWGGQICQMQGLKAVEMEFEIGEEKRSQLQVVVERAKHWKFPLFKEDIVLEWTGELKESSWEGPFYLKDDDQVLREPPPDQNLPKRQYYVVRMIWKATTKKHRV